MFHYDRAGHLIGESGSGRSISLQVRGTPRTIPLASMGDGTNRVFALGARFRF